MLFAFHVFKQCTDYDEHQKSTDVLSWWTFVLFCLFLIVFFCFSHLEKKTQRTLMLRLVSIKMFVRLFCRPHKRGPAMFVFVVG